jgi:hypothetical protein
MTMTSPDSPPTVDMEQLRRRHQDLLKDNLTKPVPPEQCQQFVEQLINAGRNAAPGRDRDALRKMLYFWAAEAVGRGAWRRDEPLPALAPYSGGGPSDERRDPSVLSTSLAAEDIEATAETRATIRIAALARQWQIAGRNAGYLLTGEALEEAKKYKDKDFEIGAFIAASEAAAARAKSRLWQGSFIALTVLTTLLGLGIWYLVDLNADLAQESAKLRLARDAVEIARTRESQQTRDEARRAIEALNAGGQDPLRLLRALLQRIGDAQPDELSRLQIGAPTGRASATSSENTVAPVGVEQRAIAPTENITCAGVLWLGNDSDKLVTNSGPLSSLQSGETITVRDGSSVRLRKSMPLPGYVMAPQIGLVPGGASLILKGKPEMHRSSNPTALDQYFAEVTAPRQYCTRVFVQYSGDESKVQSLRSLLLGISVQAPPAQRTTSAEKTAEVRVFWKDDLPVANLVATTLSPFNSDKPLAVRQLFDFPTKPAQGTLEVWIDLNR